MSRIVSRIVVCVGLLLLGAVAGAQAAGPGLRLSEQLQAPAPDTRVFARADGGIQLQAATDVRESIIRQLVLLKGRAMLGTDYVLGANSDEAVDCSSLILQMYETAGIDLPRTTRELVEIGRPVVRAHYEPGDLLFFRWGRRGLHVAVYVDEGRVLHASTSEREVVISPLTRSWNRRLVAARRLI